MHKNSLWAIISSQKWRLASSFWRFGASSCVIVLRTCAISPPGSFCWASSLACGEGSCGPRHRDCMRSLRASCSRSWCTVGPSHRRSWTFSSRGSTHRWTCGCCWSCGRRVRAVLCPFALLRFGGRSQHWLTRCWSLPSLAIPIWSWKPLLPFFSRSSCLWSSLTHRHPRLRKTTLFSSA